MASLAGLKTISILSLIVVVALASLSPALGADGAYLTVTPATGCPGTHVTLVAHWTVSGGADLSISASPDEKLFVEDGSCSIDQAAHLLTCTMVVGESVRSGRYTLTFRAQNEGDESAVAYFDALSTCGAVGGYVQPVNNFALLSPWLALVGLVGCVGSAVVIAKKRPA